MFRRGLNVIIVAVALIANAALAQSPTSFLKIASSAATWNHLKLGDNATNLWFPQTSPAAGQTHLRLWLKNIANVNWNQLAIAPGSDSAKSVPIGRFVTGNPVDWFQVDIPLSAFPAGAFNNITVISVPWSMNAAAFTLGVARVEFVGGATPRLWFGEPAKLDNLYESAFAVERVTGGSPPVGPPVSLFSATPTSGPAPLTVTFNDLSTNAASWEWSFPGATPASSTQRAPGPVTYASAGTFNAALTVRNASGQASSSQISITVGNAPPPPPPSGICPPEYYAVASSANAGYNHFKLGSNASNLWGPQLNPAAGQTHLRLWLLNRGGADWSRLAIAPNGDGSRAVAIGPYVSGSPAGWFEVRIPLAAFPANSFSNVVQMSVPFTLNAAPFGLGVGRVEFVGGAAPLLWYGAPDKPANLFESPFTVQRLAENGANCGTTPPSTPVSLFAANPTSGPAPLTVNFTDRSSGATSWEWSFSGGSPATSVAQNPQTTYAAPGTYIARQTVRNGAGVSASSEITITVGTAPPPPPPASGRTFGNFLGTNVLLDTPVEPVAEFKHLRMYVPADMFGKFARNARDLAFQPSDGWLPAMDDRLRQLSGGGARDLMLVIQGNFPYLAGGQYDVPPVAPGADSTAPASYGEIREMCYQIAARYGRARPGNVSVRSTNAPLTGLAAIGRFEPRNEVYSWWIGAPRNFVIPGVVNETRTTTDWAPEEESAMMVACAQGARAADPSLPIAAPGSTGWDKNQLARGKAWYDRINGGQFPANDYVVNLYWNQVSANFNSNYKSALDYLGQGLAPEAGGGLYNFGRQMVAEVKSKYSTANVVIGEFGWDTEPTSWQETTGTPSTDRVKQQGQWLTRGLLALHGAGVDRVYQYMITGDGTGLFESSGLTTRGYGARLSWYYVVGTLAALRDAEFVRVVDSGRADVSVYEYRDAAGRRYWALWCPTANDTTVSNYRLQIGAAASVTLKALTNGERGGWNAEPFASTLIRAADGTVGVNVSETPVFVIAQ